MKATNTYGDRLARKKSIRVASIITLHGYNSNKYEVLEVYSIETFKIKPYKSKEAFCLYVSIWQVNDVIRI